MSTDPELRVADIKARRAELKQRIEAEGCPGCYVDTHPLAPITDDARRCAVCGAGPMSGSFLHICKTGAWKGVCGACNIHLKAV